MVGSGSDQAHRPSGIGRVSSPSISGALPSKTAVEEDSGLGELEYVSSLSTNTSSGGREKYQQPSLAHNSASQPFSTPCYVHAYLDRGMQVNAESTANSDAWSSKAGTTGGAQMTPKVNEWGRDGGRRAYFEEDPVSGRVAAESQAEAGPSTATGDARETRLKTSRQMSMDEHSGSEHTVGRRIRGGKGRGKERAGEGSSGPAAEAEELEGSEDDKAEGEEDDQESISDGSSFLLSSGEEDDEDRVRSLTRQLAETAVGVREMSKQLGRARVKSTIQSVLIITKARDNHLIKLTRDLAIWLMTTPRNGKDRGLVVYVDSQLRTSKRFDAAGIKAEHPELFEPVEHPLKPSHRSNSVVSSSGTSIASAASSNASDAGTSTPAGAEGHVNGSGNGYTSGNGTSSGSASGSWRQSHQQQEGQLRYWTAEMCSRTPHLFDFVVTLGGDGTVLFCSWLFQRIVPPVLPFSLGSLGFLTNFNFSDYAKVMSSALENGIRVNLRMRFTATVYRAVTPNSEPVVEDRRRAIKSGRTGEIIMRNIQEGGWDTIETPCPDTADERFGESEQERKRDKEVMCFSTRPVETFEVLNDLVVDRGPSPYVSLLEIFGDEHHMTTAQADGICISTPTGSTAYSLAAGGSLAHPEIPAILITPICPHTLSFRPMLLPDSMEVRIVVPYNSRSTAWASFDGRGRVELKQGDHIKVSASRYPFPTVCAENQSIDWFQSISRTLKWNERQRQKSFVVVEEDADAPAKSDDGEPRKKSSEKGPNAADASGGAKLERAQAKTGSDDEEKFDIDDTSQANTRSSSPQPHRDNHHRRRSSNHHSKPRLSAGDGPPITTRRSADALPRLSALAPAQLTSLSRRTSGSSSKPWHTRGSGSNLDSASSSQPYMSPDRFGLAGPPAPPSALSERHLASADFRLPPTQDASSSQQAPDDKEKDRSHSPVSSSYLARERIGPLAAASQAVRGAASALTPSSVLSGSRSKHSRSKDRRRSDAGEGQRSGSVPAAIAGGGSGARDGSQANTHAGDANALSRKDSNQSGGTALVVYGQDESDSEDGIEET